MPLLEDIFGAQGIGATGAGGLVDSAKELGKGIASLPVTLAKLPGDFAKNPTAFFDDNGRPDLMAVLFPSYRQQKADYAKQVEAANKLAMQAQGVKMAESVASLLGNAATDTAQGETRKALVAQGMDPAMLQPYANAAKAERHAARRAGADAGLLPSVANIADVNAAQQAGQTRFSSDRQLQEIGAQGAETRRNQGNQFGLSSRLADIRHQNRLGEMGYGAEIRDNSAQYQAELNDWAGERKSKRQRINAGYQAGLNDINDESRVTRRDQSAAANDARDFDMGVQRDKYRAELGDWKRQRSEGATPNPYPVLGSLLDNGAFDSNPAAAMLAQQHVENPTDAKSAAAFLDGYQDSAFKPAAETGAPTTAREREGRRNVKTLKMMLRSGEVPPEMRGQAKAAVRGGSSDVARTLANRIGTLKAAQMTGNDPVAMATGFLASPAAEKVTPEVRQQIADAAAQRNASLLKVVMPKVLTGDITAASRVMADPGFKKAQTSLFAADAALAGLDAVRIAADVGDGSGTDPTLFSRTMAGAMPDSPEWASVALSMADPEFAARKQNLMSTTQKVLNDYIQDQTGKVANINELNRARVVAPTGNEASALLFNTKFRAFQRAIEREREIAADQADAIGNAIERNDWRGSLSPNASKGFEARRIESQRQLAEELREADANPDNQSAEPLTAEEQAALAAAGWKGGE